MKWPDLMAAVASEPVFTTGLLLVGDVDPSSLRRQLSRWVNDGRLVQLRRGLYLLAEPYRKVQPHPFLLANRLKPASYVSLQSALAEHGLIPEYVPVVTSVTTGRPGEKRTSAGTFLYKHVRRSGFFGYTSRDLGTWQAAFVAGAEKALLDLVYLTPGGDDMDYLRELRLQNMDRLNPTTLIQIAERSGSAKLGRAVKSILRLRDDEGNEPV
jgi:predicted transcriptional regulator of viral defense system